MDNNYHTFSFCRDDYMDSDTNTVNEYKLYEDINTFVKLALRNGYQLKIFDDSVTIVVEYNYYDESLSGVSLDWLGDDEYIEKYGREEDEANEDYSESR